MAVAMELDDFEATRGSPTAIVPTGDALDQWPCAGAPETMREYWSRFGFSVFRDGWFQFVNPSDYAPALAAWLKDTELDGGDEYMAVTRNAFGELNVWGAKTGYAFTIAVLMDGIVLNEENDEEDIRKGNGNRRAESLMWSEKVRPLDKASARQPISVRMFLAAQKRLGPLRSNQMYGFVPALPMGGCMDADTLQIVDAPEHLTMLAGLSSREILTFDDIATRAFGADAVSDAHKMRDGQN
ncbi:MAG: GAD-like domain-containing protein [Erythrobacter sp.]